MPKATGTVVASPVLISGRGVFVLVEITRGTWRRGGTLFTGNDSLTITAIEGVRADGVPGSTVAVGAFEDGALLLFHVGQRVEFTEADAAS